MKTSCFFRVPILGGAKFVGLITLLIYTFIAVHAYLHMPIYEHIFLRVLDHPILQAIYGDSKEGMSERLSWRKDADNFFGSYIAFGIFGYSILQTSLSFLMLCGIQCNTRVLMMPHIVINTIKSFLEVTLAMFTMVLMLIATHWYASIISFWVPVALLGLSITSIYFQLVVPIRAYVKMGNTNYTVEPINYDTLKDETYQNFKGGLYI